MVEQMLAQRKLVRVLTTYRRASTGLGLQLVYTSRPPVPPAVAAFAEFLLEKLGNAMPGSLQAMPAVNESEPNRGGSIYAARRERGGLYWR
jgi:hypothetical protein